MEKFKLIKKVGPGKYMTYKKQTPLYFQLDMYLPVRREYNP